MPQTSHWKILCVGIVTVFAILFCLPNIIGTTARDKINHFLPNSLQLNAINLGLDLQGGAHLLLSIDLDVALQDLMKDIEEQTRQVLRSNKIGYRYLQSTIANVSLTLRDIDDIKKVRKNLQLKFPQMDVTILDDGKVTIAMTDEQKLERSRMMLAQSVEIVRKRIDALGTREPVIQAQGTSRIIVQVPGIDDPEQLKRTLGKTAKMTFHLLHKDFPPYTPIPTNAPLSAKILSSNNPESANEPRRYVVEKRIRVSGDQLVDAQPTIDQGGRSIVNFRFNNAGARRFGETTQNNVNRHLAIVLDGKVVSAPVIREPILGGNGQISGQFSQTEVQELALVLRAGALPAPI